MSLDDFKTDKSRNTHGKTINSQEIAVQAIKEAEEYIDGSGKDLTRRKFDEIKEEMGYSTSAGHFKSVSGIFF